MLKKLRCLVATLILLAAPAWAADDPPPLEAYGALPGVEDMAISSSGKRIALIGLINRQRQLLVTEGDKALVLFPIDDMKIRDILWAGDDMIILVASRTDKLPFGFTAKIAEIFGTILIPLDGGKSEMVFYKRRNIGNFTSGRYGIRDIDGQWKGYFGGVELKIDGGRTTWLFKHGRPALFEVDLKKNSPKKIAPAADSGQSRRWLIDANGEVAVTLDMAGTGEWEIENANGDEIAKGVNSNGGVSLLSFGQTPSSIIYITEQPETGDVRWFEVPLVGGEAKEVFAHVDIDQVYTDRNDGTLLGYLQGAGRAPKPVFFAPEHQAVLDKLYQAFPNFKLTIVDWTPNFSHFIVLIRGNGESGTYYIVDIENLKADQAGFERPAIFPRHVGQISTVAYKASDGLDLDGILTLPPGREAKNLPVIMFPHGGPSSQSEETFDWWAQAFASRGYAVFQPNFRGSTNRDDAFRYAGHGQWGRKMQTDISDGLAELVKLGIADPKRACIMGASYGGYAALAGVTLQKGLYRCSVAVAPVSDLELRYNYWMRVTGHSKMSGRNMVESMGDPSGYDEISPRQHADRADAPILLIHGKDDTVVDFRQSAKMADALKSAGKPHKLVVLREEDHWLSKAKTRKQMLEEAMRFIQKHNPAD